MSKYIFFKNCLSLTKRKQPKPNWQNQSGTKTKPPNLPEITGKVLLSGETTYAVWIRICHAVLQPLLLALVDD